MHSCFTFYWISNSLFLKELLENKFFVATKMHIFKGSMTFCVIPLCEWVNGIPLPQLLNCKTLFSVRYAPRRNRECVRSGDRRNYIQLIDTLHFVSCLIFSSGKIRDVFYLMCFTWRRKQKTFETLCVCNTIREWEKSTCVLVTSQSASLLRHFMLESTTVRSLSAILMLLLGTRPKQDTQRTIT